MSKSVQFYGAKNVIKAFEYKEMPNWALFQDKALLHVCEGEGLEESGRSLEEFLSMIAAGNSAIYTLKVYKEDISDITEKTAANGSFNFRLVSDEDRIAAKEYYDANRSRLIQRIEALEAEKEDEEPKDFLGKIGAMITDDPEKLGQLATALPQVLQAAQFLISSIFQPRQQHPAPAPVEMQRGPGSISGINDDPGLNQAIALLQRNDPQISQHLQKLARLSEVNPGQFKMLIGMLDAMNI
jgi:hypothetical protein